MPTLTLPDRTIAYDDSHPGGDERTAVLLHGFAMSRAAWDPMRLFLPDTTRVVAPDLRGHGASHAAPLTGLTLAELVDDVVALVDHLGLDRPSLVGNSLGAVVVTEVLLTRPGLAGRATLLGSPGHSLQTDEGFASGMASMAQAMRRDPVAAARAAVPGWFGVLGGPAVVDWAVGLASRLDPEAAGIIGDLASWDPRPGLPRIDVPIHYVHGRHDSIPLDAVTEDVALTPGARLTVAEHAGHMPHVETPGWTAGVLEQPVAT